MFALTPGRAVAIASGVWRVLALNPGMMSGPGTNSYLIADQHGLMLLDPGPADDRHLDNLEAAARELDAPIHSILCSHTHRDHSPGAALFRKRQPDVQVLGPAPLDDNLQDDSWRPDRILSDGEVLELDEQRRLKVVSTPGHVSNHLCYLLEPDAMLFSGDHLINGSTVVIAPPSGSMSAYLASLRRLQPMGVRTIAPGHGDLIVDPANAIAATIAHRLKREDRVLDALAEASEPTSPSDLVPAVYEDVPAFLHPIAEFSLHAHLIKLVEDGRVTEGPERHYRICTTGE